eukprot:CAMPEP_0201578968 /NCGR_PEP_ID=MMETSP0190_2-20130828/26148_1 /ASSEMBLY_ACC=CAM_ASM_000263 /TAXON_ID=37353 /ORGANISM="Rosalina sp." /LENGTH=53 /DNA_ID=CAMNT_0048012745 /DNA_START=80 /DNA_END=241 /DNA_ORIENTATION=-
MHVMNPYQIVYLKDLHLWVIMKHVEELDSVVVIMLNIGVNQIVDVDVLQQDKL